jgi:hypothetical protein
MRARRRARAQQQHAGPLLIYERARLIARSSCALVMLERPSIFNRFAWL